MIRPTTTYKGVEEIVQLDVRISTLLGQELADEINASIDRQQLFAIVTPPSLLILSQPQFDSLMNYTEEMYQTTDRLFRTTAGYIMEVEVRKDNDHVVTDEEDIKRAMEADEREEQS